MKSFVKRYSIVLIVIFMFFIMNTKSNAFYVKEFDFSRQTLKSNNIYGICKIYRDNEAFYYKKNSSGSYTESVEASEVTSLRNEIKQAINSIGNGEYLIGKILKSNSYYDEANKEFCFKRNASSVSIDTTIKVVILGYDDNYQFKSNLTNNKGAYRVKKVGDTEEFYVSYEDTWIESELSFAYDANTITLDKTSISLKVGETVDVHYTVLPEDSLSKNVTVSYSDGIEIDTTTSGTVKITGITAGDADIIVKLKSDNTITAKCDIKVIPDIIIIPPSSSPSPEVPSPTPVIPSPNPVIPSPTPVVPSPSPEVPSPTPVIPSPSPVIPSPSPEPIEKEITSNKYLLDEAKNYIYRIAPNIKLNEFKSNIISKVDYQIIDKNGNAITDETVLVSTGMKLKTQKQEYILIVKGDIDGNGRINLTDLVKANLYNTHILSPNEIEKISADVSGDGKITITDVVQFKLASVNIKPIE